MGRTYSFELLPIQIGKREPKMYRLPPSLNARMHWATRAKHTTEWVNQVLTWCAVGGIPALAGAKITIQNFTVSPRDRDNMYTSVKPIVDGIVRAGVIPDDSEKYLDLKVANVKVGHKIDEKLVVTIEAADLSQSFGLQLGQGEARMAKPDSDTSVSRRAK